MLDVGVSTMVKLKSVLVPPPSDHWGEVGWGRSSSGGEFGAPGGGGSTHWGERFFLLHFRLLAVILFLDFFVQVIFFEIILFYNFYF